MIKHDSQLPVGEVEESFWLKSEHWSWLGIVEREARTDLSLLDTYRPWTGTGAGTDTEELVWGSE